VLQIFAQSGQEEPVLDKLMAHALGSGCVAVRGRLQPSLADSLSMRGCIFFHHSATIVHTRQEELREASASGNAFITGLAAESWTRLIGGVFD
jgi:hypothetical protein